MSPGGDAKAMIESMRVKPSESYRNEEWLRHHYEDMELSTNDIADIVGCSKSTILHWMGKFGIEGRSKSESVGIAKERIRQATGNPNARRHSPTHTTWPSNVIPPAYQDDLGCRKCPHREECHEMESHEYYMPLLCQSITLEDVLAIWDRDPTLLIELLRRYF